MGSIEENLKTIHKNMQKVALEYGRDVDNINLIAVSKYQPAEKIQEALDAGHRIFGENKVQEAIEHWAHLKPDYPDLDLHFIGALQTNKVKDAISLFDMIHSVDREKLARKLASEMKAQDKNIPCLIQVNIGEEAQKAGIMPQELPEFIKFCQKDCALNIQGLMCIPPVDEPPALFFALLQNMAREFDLPHLSMGMSSDYQKAIPLGATYIRVGTSIFGERTL